MVNQFKAKFEDKILRKISQNIEELNQSRLTISRVDQIIKQYINEVKLMIGSDSNLPFGNLNPNNNNLPNINGINGIRYKNKNNNNLPDIDGMNGIHYNNNNNKIPTPFDFQHLKVTV